MCWEGMCVGKEGVCWVVMCVGKEGVYVVRSEGVQVCLCIPMFLWARVGIVYAIMGWCYCECYYHGNNMYSRV